MKLLLTLLAAVLLLATAQPASAQADIYGVFTSGALFQNGDADFTFAMGGDIPINTVKDSTGDVRYVALTRLQLFYVDRDDDFKGAAVYSMHEVPVISTFRVSAGGGVTYKINDGEDSFDPGGKVEILWCPKAARVAFIAGFDYQPLPGPDIKTVYGGLNLLAVR